MNDRIRFISREEQEKIETFQKIGAGACANLYRNGNEAYKILKENSKGLYRNGSLEKLVGIKSSICVFPNEVLKDKDGLDIGYTMDFIVGKKMKDVFQNLSFEQLQQILTDADLGIEELSQQKIAFDDMHFDNIMWDEENHAIKIIDTDFFKFADELSVEELNLSNQTEFNNQMEILIGLRDGVLAKYLGRNEEYTQFYKEYFKRGLKGEKLNSYELIDKIKTIAEKDFGTEFHSISQIEERAKEKVKEYEDEEMDIENWSEGNEHLRNLLKSCRDNKVPSMFSCAGHGKGKPAYVTVQMNEQTIGKIYSIMSQMTDVKDISLRFAQKEFGKDPSFTIYMQNEQSKNEVMDMISLALAQEKTKDELPENFQKLIQINDIFKNEDIGFDLGYDIGKSNNKLLLENLKFGNSEWLEKSDFKRMGLRSRENMFGKMQYFKNGIKNEKESNILGGIIENLNQIYDIDYERPEELTLIQKIAQKISSNGLLGRIPFIDKFVKRQLYVLPETTQKQNVHSINEQRKSFLDELSNGGEYMRLSERATVKNTDRNNIASAKAITGKSDYDDLDL